MASDRLATAKRKIGSRYAKPIAKPDWPQLNRLRKLAKGRRGVQVDMARKLEAVASRMLGAASYVLEEDGPCETNAWQLALALLALCELQYGQGSEFCFQQFNLNLALFLQPCQQDPDGGGTGG